MPANTISALRNMVDDIEKLGAAPLTVDVSVLRQAIVYLGMLETGLTTIKLQSDLLAAMGDEMRSVGCVYDQNLGKAVNTLAPPEGYVLVPLEPTDDMAFPATHIEVGYPMWAGSRDTCTYAEAKAIWHAMIAARPEVP